MDGLITCDLLKGYPDLHGITRQYVMDSLDTAALHLAEHDNPYLCNMLMKCWDTHKTEMIEIFDRCYPENELPKWVNYEGFREDMIERMTGHLFTVLADADWWIDDENPSATKINFSDIISFPIMAEPMCYEISSRATDQLSINMSVDLRAALDDLRNVGKW